MARQTVHFIAVILMALALIPAGAHLFELPNKLGLSPESYMAVQGLYAGWALFGIVYIGALIANLVLAAMLWRQRRPFRLALAAAASVVAFFAIFFTWTFPANRATTNWTQMPVNLDALRRAWEISHAVNAVVLFVGFCAVVLAAFDARDRRL